MKASDIFVEYRSGGKPCPRSVANTHTSIDWIVSSKDCNLCFREPTGPKGPSGPLSVLPISLPLFMHRERCGLIQIHPGGFADLAPPCMIQRTPVDFVLPSLSRARAHGGCLPHHEQGGQRSCPHAPLLPRGHSGSSHLSPGNLRRGLSLLSRRHRRQSTATWHSAAPFVVAVHPATQLQQRQWQ